jgi:hypothetical protein
MSYRFLIDEALKQRGSIDEIAMRLCDMDNQEAKKVGLDILRSNENLHELLKQSKRYII